MTSRLYQGWLTVSLDAWSLGAESAAVAALRMSKMAAGGSAGAREAALMVSEKVQAGLELQALLLAAGPQTPLGGTNKVLRHYQKKVAANRRRLSR